MQSDPLTEAPPPIELSRYAEALAYLREYHATERALVLRQLQLSEAELTAAAAHWSRSINAALAQGLMTPVIELARAYGIAERFARVQRPPLPRLKSHVKAAAADPRATVAVRTRAPLRSQANDVVQENVPRPTGNLVPSYLRADAQPSMPGELPVDPNATQAAIPMLSVSLPFEGSLSREALQEMLSRPAPAPAPEQSDHVSSAAHETALLPQLTLVAATSGTFRDRLAAIVVPVMSLEDYAELRARLTVFGETHEPTLKRYGVVASEARDALRAQFAEQFQRDASLQERFLTAMQAAMSRARREREDGAGN